MPTRGKKPPEPLPPLEVLTSEQARVWKALAEPSREWNAYLAGGAGLAIHLRHRQSKDFDWFTRSTVEPSKILSDVTQTGLHLDRLMQNTIGSFHAIVSGTEVSLFRYPYPILEPSTTWEGGELASILDIAAMKISALRQRSSKRDFVDLCVLITSTPYTLEDMLVAFGRKYQVRPIEALEGLTYFSPIDKAMMPFMLIDIRWPKIRSIIELAVATLDRSRLQTIPLR